MQRRFNFLTIFLVSFTLFLGLAAALQGAAYAQCSGGKILVQKTNKKGKIHFICVSPYAVKGLMKGDSINGVWGLHLLEMDFGSDGSIDRIGYYQTNDDGRTIELEHDGPPVDGIIDDAFYWEYDADGNRVLGEDDVDNDGILDNAVYYAYDADGNNISIEYNEGYDATIEQTYEYEYDFQNRLTLTTHVNNLYPANNYTEERFYLPGDQILIETYKGDPLSFHKYQMWNDFFDADGNRIRREIDDLNDTTIDSIIYWQWDTFAGQDHWIRYDIDNDNNGIIDLTYLQDFDQFGHIARVEVIDLVDPSNNQIQYYTWILK